MISRETLPAKCNDLIEPIQLECSKFYNRYRSLLHSIVLTGSLARGEISSERKSFDADIVLVARHYYNPILCRFLERQLGKKVLGIKFDAGRSILLSRLEKEKSLFSYDIKNTGIIMAGNDVREAIPSIFPCDLYPFESLRLLLNASCHIALSLGNTEDQIKQSLDKALKWCVDAYLLYQGEFAPTHRQRTEIAKRNHPEFFKEIQDTTDSNDVNTKYAKGRLELLGIMDLIRENLELDSIEKLVDFFEKKCNYPFLFRLYSVGVNPRFISFFKNPIFNVYSWALKTISISGKLLATDYSVQKRFENIWTRLPQPMIKTK